MGGRPAGARSPGPCGLGWGQEEATEVFEQSSNLVRFVSYKTLRLLHGEGEKAAGGPG